MYQHGFTTARANQHRADLIADAERARDALLVGPRRRGTHAKKLAIAAAFTTLATGGIAAAAAAPWPLDQGSSHQPGPPDTPNQ
jgi:hypothetical protein